MISARMRVDLDEYAAAHSEPEAVEQDDGGTPSLAFAAACTIASGAISFWVIYRVIAWIVE